MKGRLLSRYAAMLVALLLITLNSAAQIWKSPMANSNTNFYTIQNAFNHDMRSTLRKIEREQTKGGNSVSSSKKTTNNEESEEEMEGYLQFKRWEHFMEPRVFPSGDLSLPSSTWNYFQTYLNNTPAAMQMYLQGNGNPSVQHSINPNTIQSSSWTFAGPTGSPIGSGAGRIGFVRLDPTNANTIWVGAPAGGLWKSTNGGASWVTGTDFLSVIGASDVVIDSTNTQIMYLATGDGDAGDTYSIGVLKSIDGGVTWNPSGLTWTVNQGRTIRKLLIMPGTPSTIMAFSNVGIWRTTNSGATWTQVLTTSCFDAEFMPQTPNTIYACGKDFFKSTNGGATWTTITTGLPTAASVNRLAIAVTAASSATIYLVAGSAANSGLYGFYKSTNSGTSFTQITIASPSNLLGWSNAGSDVGGQSWYDLTIDCSPTNANEVCVGGVNLWRTTNGGTNWTLNGHWTGSGAPYVHADQHAMLYLNATTMLIGCDGGVFKTTNNGGAWADLSNNLCIAQMYRIGLSGQTGSPNFWLTGHQDNGTNLKNGATYARTLGGDGMDCFIDRTNNNVMYAEYYNGTHNRSTNGGGTWTGITSGLTGNAPWVTSWYQDPTVANTIYCGRSNIWKSTNQGTTWAMLTALPGSGTVVDFKVAPSSNQTIYVVRSNAVYVTTNGGTTWTTITGTLPVGTVSISRVDVNPSNPLTAIVTFSGYSSGNKAFKTINGGTTWTNISTGLPNLPCNTVRYDASSLIGAVYIGADVGVYYMDSTFVNWQPYFIGLPNVPIFDLEIHAGTSKLRAASYGRGVWEVDIYNTGTMPPIAQFSPNTFITCTNTLVNFTDLSTFNPTSWAWTFPSGSPATSTSQNPSGVSWATAGTYTVTLSTSNANGTSSTTQVITVLGSQTPPIVEGFQSATFVPVGWTANNINNDGVFWNLATVGSGSSQSARFDNYNMDVSGAKDEIWAPRLNCSSLITMQLTFDVAYARYDAVYSDSLQVLVSTNCGATWTSVYLKGGTNTPGNLATAPDQTSSLFVPSPIQWRNESVSLNAYIGQSSVFINFRNLGHYGQALYVDNINITGTVSALPSATFTASSLSVCAGVPVSFTDASTNSPTGWSWTFPGGTPASATTQNVASVIWNTAGTYTVTHTATNVSGTGASTQVIIIKPLPTVTTTTTSGIICTGNSTSITASGAVSYTWMPGNLSGGTITISPATTTTYTVTGTGANGCTKSATRTITVNPIPTVTTTTTSGTICAGNSTSITASGASSYNWMPGNLSGATITVSPLTTTTYTVTGNTAGCTNTATRTITVNPAPNITTTTTAATICVGNSSSITATGGATYMWMPGNLSGATITISPAATTTYTVTGTGANGCTNTATRTITVNPTPIITITTTLATVCSGNNTSLTASGATSYVWMPGNLSGATIIVSPTTTTTYTATGTNGNGCVGSAIITITTIANPTILATTTMNTICAGGTTTITASGANSYSWMPGNLSGTTVTVSPLSTTTYTVIGTATNGCTNTTTQTITVSAAPNVTIFTPSFLMCSAANATLTASGATSYTWQPGNLSGATITVSPLSTTTYTVVGTNGNGCTNSATQMIVVSPSPTVVVTATNSSICYGDSVTLVVSGASVYNWMPGNLSNATVTYVPANSTTYTVIGTYPSGCSDTLLVPITVNIIPTVTASISADSVCIGNSITLTGFGAATYSWQPINMSGSPITDFPISSTTYTVTGLSAAGCSNTSTVSVFVNSIPLVNAVASSNLICLGASVNLNGTGAASYLWQPINLSGPTVSDAPTTTVTYTVTGTDLNGCINIDSTTVTVVPQPTVSIAGLNIICPGNSVSLTASGATSYAWLPGGQTTATIIDSPITSTTYSVIGTDSLGCFSLATHTVVIDIPPATPIVIVNGNVLTSNVIGANYQWFLNGVPIPFSTGQSCTATVLGTYTVEVYDSLGCGSGQSAAVVDPTGIAQLNDFDFMRVIPNPNDGHFMLSIHTTKTDNYILEIQNMLGQIVYREILNNLAGNYNHEINLTNYGVGVYTIRLINSEKEQIIKSVTY